MELSRMLMLSSVRPRPLSLSILAKLSAVAGHVASVLAPSSECLVMEYFNIGQHQHQHE
jgi:hypothetical protein